MTARRIRRIRRVLVNATMWLVIAGGTVAFAVLATLIVAIAAQPLAGAR